MGESVFDNTRYNMFGWMHGLDWFWRLGRFVQVGYVSGRGKLNVQSEMVENIVSYLTQNSIQLYSHVSITRFVWMRQIEFFLTWSIFAGTLSERIAGCYSHMYACMKLGPFYEIKNVWVNVSLLACFFEFYNPRTWNKIGGPFAYSKLYDWCHVHSNDC